VAVTEEPETGVWRPLEPSQQIPAVWNTSFSQILNLILSIFQWQPETTPQMVAQMNQNEIDVFIDETWENGGFFDLAHVVHLVEGGSLPG